MNCRVSATKISPVSLRRTHFCGNLKQKSLTLPKPFSHLLRMNLAESTHDFQLGFFDSRYLWQLFLFSNKGRRTKMYILSHAKHCKAFYAPHMREREREREREFHQYLYTCAKPSSFHWFPVSSLLLPWLMQ